MFTNLEMHEILYDRDHSITCKDASGTGKKIIHFCYVFSLRRFYNPPLPPPPAAYWSRTEFSLESVLNFHFHSLSEKRIFRQVVHSTTWILLKWFYSLIFGNFVFFKLPNLTDPFVNVSLEDISNEYLKC